MQAFLDTSPVAFHLEPALLFYHLHVGHLDLVRRAGHLLARVGRKPRKTAHRLLHLFGRDAQVFCNLGVTKRHQVVETLFQNLERKGRKIFQGFRLDDKTFLKVPGADSPGPKTPEHMEGLYHRETRLFEGDFVADHLLDFDDERIVVGHDLCHGHLVGTLQKTVFVQGVNQVFHQAAETNFWAPRLCKLCHKFAGSVPVPKL